LTAIRGNSAEIIGGVSIHLQRPSYVQIARPVTLYVDQVRRVRHREAIREGYVLSGDIPSAAMRSVLQDGESVSLTLNPRIREKYEEGKDSVSISVYDADGKVYRKYRRPTYHPRITIYE
jgi:hypothetical protein